MAFKVGDWVVHPQHGLGQVTRLETKQFGSGEAQKYYEIALPKSTLWVPVESPLIGLRPLTAKNDLSRYRGLLKGPPVPLSQDHHQRRGELMGRLKPGTFLVKCEVVRDLTAQSWRKRLSEVEATLLRNTRDGLCQEWAVSEGVSVSDATQEVETLLREAKQAYQPQP